MCQKKEASIGLHEAARKAMELSGVPNKIK